MQQIVNCSQPKSRPQYFVIANQTGHSYSFTWCYNTEILFIRSCPGSQIWRNLFSDARDLTRKWPSMSLRPIQARTSCSPSDPRSVAIPGPRDSFLGQIRLKTWPLEREGSESKIRLPTKCPRITFQWPGSIILQALVKASCKTWFAVKGLVNTTCSGSTMLHAYILQITDLYVTTILILMVSSCIPILQVRHFFAESAPGQLFFLFGRTRIEYLCHFNLSVAITCL